MASFGTPAGTSFSSFSGAVTVSGSGDVSNLYVYKYGTFPVNGWGQSIHMQGGTSGGGTRTIKLAAYQFSGDTPTTLLAGTVDTTISTDWDPGFGGAIALVDGPSPIDSGTSVGLGVLVQDTGTLMIAQLGIDRAWRYADVAGTALPTTFTVAGSLGAVDGGSIRITYEPNVAPDTPTNLSPSGTIQDSAPTFSADFADDNEVDGDALNQFRIQVRRVSDSTIFWDTTLTANAGEIAADAISRVYGGTALVRGTAYEWRTQMSDYFSTWSSWSAWTAFTPVELGFITLDSDPTGKIEDNTPDFKGRWTHQSSDDMTVVQVRLLNASGSTILQTGSEYNIVDVASSASPGTLFTVAWADTGFSTLAWGTSYRYQIRGKDESATWSDWSASRSFATNAAPTVPTSLSPTSSQILTDYPLLTCTATDADDTTGSGFVVKARIKDDVGAVLFTRSMTLSGSTWQYQTDGTDLATYDTYRWDAYSGDGTLWSGEIAWASEASATKSAESIFVYAEGPTVTITSPTEAEVITTANITITWTTTDQQKYRVYLYEDGSTTAVYDSGEKVSTTSSHNIPSGYLENDHAYDLVVEVTDSTPLTGTSAIRNFTVDYVEPAAIAAFTATAISVGTDLWDSAYQLTWEQTSIGTSEWQEYTIWRRADSGIDETPIILARLTSPLQVSYIDYVPQSGVQYTYSITQTIITGLDELSSTPVEAIPEPLAIGGVVLCSVTDPAGIRTALRYTNERENHRDIDEQVYQPLNGATPTTVRSRRYVRMPVFDVRLFDDEAATAGMRREELETIDQAQGTFCYRDNHGRKLFITVPDLTINDQVPDWYIAKVSAREETYTEGVA